MDSQSTLRQVGAELHARLLTGASATVTSEIAEVFLPAVSRSLRGEFRNLGDPHLTDIATADALLAYFDDPARFDPHRAGLFTYLRWRARSRLLNLLAGQNNSPAPDEAVEVEASAPVYQVTEGGAADPEDALVRREANEATLRKLGALFTDPRDLELVRLMLAGVRETAHYAALLGITALPAEEQARLVKRHKDRVKKVVQRKYRREEG
jgi:RNA polymerase sigma-70 factor, ECF subfamily